ncbi:unnamed protein product [Thelazia callipaeda]|uniref:Uncharacterized protein n=1 Tax=Thelazia callipaeda TaxID=103827 RepID=A0A0N5D1A1_THECL|nr:unnamed protein product [Thelazia callipaeda]
MLERGAEKEKSQNSKVSLYPTAPSLSASCGKRGWIVSRTLVMGRALALSSAPPTFILKCLSLLLYPSSPKQ